MAFTFNFPDVNCGFRLEQKYWQINRFGEKKAQIGRLCIPLFIPLPQETENIDFSGFKKLG